MGRVLYGKCLGEWDVQCDVTWHAAIDSTSIDPDDSFRQVKVFRLIDFPISSSPFSFLVFFYSSSVLYANIRLIKFDTNFIAIISENRITARFLRFFLSFFFPFSFFSSVSTYRSMHRLRDYLEISWQTTIMLRIMARLGRDDTPRRTTRIEN